MKAFEIERAPDEFDRASNITAAENAYLEAQVRAAAAPKQVPDENGNYEITECECGEDIPLERLRHGFINCVFCQERIEGAHKWKRGGL